MLVNLPQGKLFSGPALRVRSSNWRGYSTCALTVKKFFRCDEEALTDLQLACQGYAFGLPCLLEQDQNGSRLGTAMCSWLTYDINSRRLERSPILGKVLG